MKFKYLFNEEITDYLQFLLPIGVIGLSIWGWLQGKKHDKITQQVQSISDKLISHKVYLEGKRKKRQLDDHEIATITSKWLVIFDNIIRKNIENAEKKKGSKLSADENNNLVVDTMQKLITKEKLA